MASASEATLGEKVTLLPKVLTLAFGSAFLNFGSYFLSGGEKARSAVEHVAFGVCRTVLSTITIGQEQLTIVPTQKSYEAKCKALNVEPQINTLKSGVKCYWLGSRNAEKVVLYFHGGGYVLSGGPAHFDLLHELQVGLSSSSGKSVGVVALDYTLAPHAQYPTQLKEAVESLAWLINDLEKKPEDIVVMGDSAGGNMVLALLSHCLHPHPNVSERVNLSEPLSSAVLISPWCTFDTTDGSFKEYAASDIVTPEILRRWSSMFLGSASPDRYNQPTLAEVDWFEGIESLTNNILVWAGGAEVLVDSIKQVTNVLEKAHSKTTLVVEPGAPHEAMIIDKMIGYRTYSEAPGLISSFVAKSW